MTWLDTSSLCLLFNSRNLFFRFLFLFFAQTVKTYGWKSDTSKGTNLKAFASEAPVVFARGITNNSVWQG